MNYDEYMRKQEQIAQQSIPEQKRFYERLLENKYDKTEVHVHAAFCYGRLFYQEGNFRKVIEIMEPIVVDYQSYPYTPRMLSCFNLMGVATHCEMEYSVSRFFYETALRLAKEHHEKYYYAFEYNDIALTYLEEKNYEAALATLAQAEAVLKDCDQEMGAYVYINQSITLQKLGRLQEARQAFEIAVREYQAEQVIPDDVTRCAATLSYRLGRLEEYEGYKRQVLDKLGEMYAAEFMEACKELFACGMDSGDEALMTEILGAMDRYMEGHPKEIRVGLAFSELKYDYAVRRADTDAIIRALEAKNDYQGRIIEYAKENRIKTLQQYMEISSQILELEHDALTGFWNRKAYHKDITVIERDEDRSQRPVGVVFADVNGLKRINDSQGHEAGDALIASVAGDITTVFPKAKWYRFGGDEFVVLSFDKEEAAFREKLDRLTKLWEEGRSASIGSVWLEHAKDIDRSVSVADEIMYADKSRYYDKKGKTRTW